MNAQMHRGKKNRPRRLRRHQAPRRNTGEREIIALGDIHGELEGLREVLRHAGIAGEQDRWTGGRRTFVQLGDIIDRGSLHAEAETLLSALQEQAPLSGGKVIRLIGNHELELLRGNYYITTLTPGEAMEFRRQVVLGIMSGKLVGAHSEQGHLFTHAGITLQMQKLLEAEIGPFPADESGLAEHINATLRRSVAENDYLHPIFHIGASRGGHHKHGGIFWEDVRELFADGAERIRQIVGHTPVKDILFSHCKRIAAIDVGLYNGYGGGRAYLRIKNGVAEPVYLNQEALPAYPSAASKTFA